MDINSFFDVVDCKTIPVFITTEDMTVDTYVWFFGNSPRTELKQFTIPKGTELIVCDYSNFGDGYSMKPLHPRRVFNGLNLSHRWFRCPYASMEFSRRVEA